MRCCWSWIRKSFSRFDFLIGLKNFSALGTNIALPEAGEKRKPHVADGAHETHELRLGNRSRTDSGKDMDQ
jgi:hypothetical protein